MISSSNPGPLKQQQIFSNGKVKPPVVTRHVTDEPDSIVAVVPDLATRRDWLDLMNQRIAHAQQYCQQHTHYASGQHGVFFLYEAKQIAYCFVPKNGCTFWKGIMRFLNKDFPPENRNISTPFDLSRHFIHFGQFETTPKITLNQRGAAKLHKMVNSFMFTRDPYSRLWSLYLDKLVLPDFWSMGRMIIRLERHHPTQLSLQCGHDVSFPEFIRFVVKEPYSNGHFAPIHTMCDPCKTHFKFIGKVETFVQDAKHIMNETGIISDVGMTVSSDTAIHEMKLISQNLLNKKFGTLCHNKTLICKRLWNVFQKNGYIGFEIDFPSDLSNIKDSEKLEKAFIARVIETYQNGASFHDDWKKQRRESLVYAYRTVSIKTLKAIQATYKRDFDMFGYDIEPVDIYETITDDKTGV